VISRFRSCREFPLETLKNEQRISLIREINFVGLLHNYRSKHRNKIIPLLGCSIPVLGMKVKLNKSVIIFKGELQNSHINEKILSRVLR